MSQSKEVVEALMSGGLRVALGREAHVVAGDVALLVPGPDDVRAQFLTADTCGALDERTSVSRNGAVSGHPLADGLCGDADGLGQFGLFAADSGDSSVECGHARNKA